jgi:hypothetical protein
MEQELPTLPEHLSSSPVLTGVRVIRSLVLRYDTCINILTVTRPNIPRIQYTSITDVLAHTGVNSVQAHAIAIATPKTRFPPYLSANQPPGI